MFHRPRRTARTLGIVIVTLLVTQVLVASPASAGTLFNMSGDVYYLSGGVKTVGWPIVSESTNSQPNAWATAFAYRSNVIGDATNRTSESNAPTTHHIYQPWRPVDGPAYTLWDVGSSAWGNQSVVGDTPVVVAMTTAGVNGWTGPTWVSGTRTTVTIAMVGNSQADFADAQMEQIPTPAYIGATTSSVTIGWTDLLDAGHTAQGTSTVVPSAKSIVGYSLYRSVNGGAFTMLPDGSFTAQNAGAATTYTDSAVVPGSTYQYHLGVRFEWTA